MLSAVSNFFHHNKREDVTGAIYHTIGWTLAGFSDVIIENPQFKPEYQDKNESVAIYCVHGTSDRNHAFCYLIDKMMHDKKGLSDKIVAAHLIAFDGRFQGNNIEFFANQLLDKIVSQGHTNVILMGHSRGGLVVSDLAESMAKTAGINVICVIPIASPFMGTSLASWPISFFSASVKEMVPDSVFLKNLQEKIRQSDIPYFYIAAENDSIVSPESCCIPLLRDSMTIIKKHGHLSIMYSNELAFILQNKLDNLFQIEAIVESKSEPNYATR